MDWDIMIELLPALGSMAGTLIGILTGTKLTNYRLKQLEERVQAHNNLIERTYVLEGQVTECRHDIRDLRSYHRP